jgi:hypothetical protein
MTQINYISGDATVPVGSGKKFIVHCCNDVGGWGAGFVIALSNKWKAPEQSYREWAKELSDKPQEDCTFKLGNYRAVRVEEDIWVVNMIGQRSTRWVDNIPPVRYESIEKALNKLAHKLAELRELGHEVSVHAPKFGSDLAGGDWSIIEQIIENTLCKKEIDVTVYNFNG